MAEDDRNHDVVRAWMDETTAALITTPLAVAEMDHMMSRFYHAPKAVTSLYRNLRESIYVVEWWPTAMQEALDLAAEHRKLGIGLTDASLVALAAHLDTLDIATLDERHFRQIPHPTRSEPFRILPADA